MAFSKSFSWCTAAIAVGLFVASPVATAQYSPWYGRYYDNGIYDYDTDWYYDDYDYTDYGRQSPAVGVRRVLDDPNAEWEHDPLTDEWEIESVHGEVDYEPRGYFAPTTRSELEQAIRSALTRPGSWEYEPLEGEWEYETPAGSEVEYESGARLRFYDYDYYDYGYNTYDYSRSQSPERGVERVLEDPAADWDYEPLGDEWEIESVHGEVDYEPEGYFEPGSREELKRAIRRELEGPGEWDFEPLEDEWEYETPAGDEIEYEPASRY